MHGRPGPDVYSAHGYRVPFMPASCPRRGRLTVQAQHAVRAQSDTRNPAPPHTTHPTPLFIALAGLPATPILSM